ncbi:MAG TPA: PRC-barrel domain-containing protein [Rubrobacteraceae bacterium]|nr:PRC-barrel domain-containing protein [Rubrobacteraceae bacterium]
MDAEGRGDRFQKLEESYKDYTVYDQHYEKIGKVDDLFVDNEDQPEYIGVKTGFLGTKSTLIPMEIARVNDRRKLIEVAADREAIKDAPTFDNDEEITPEREHRIHSYFGLERPESWNERGGYGDYYHSDTEDHAREDLTGSVDTEYGERRGESSDRPIETAPSREERYDTESSRSGASDRGDLDIPLDDTEHGTERNTGPERPRGYTDSTEPREDTAEPERDPIGGDATARTEREDQTFTDEGESRGMRIHKRVRTRSE